MHDLYRSQLEIARALPSDVETLTHLSSILRSLLQAGAICAIEIVQQAAPATDHDTELDRFLDRFAQPSDGLPIEVLDHLVPAIRGLVSRQYFRGWYEPVESDEAPLVNDLGEWVKFRNRRLGHGVVDAPTAAAWAEKTDALISRLLAVTGVLPTSEKGTLSVKVGDVDIRLSTPLVIDGHPSSFLRSRRARGCGSCTPSSCRSPMPAS